MLNWGGKKWRPGGSRPQPNRINQSVSELMKPLGEKSWQGNVWGSVIMNVQKGEEPTPPTPTPTPTPSSTPVPAWNPSQLSNLYDWWNTGEGITLSGSSVLSWEGYNGTLFTPMNITYKPTYISSDSDWNNNPSIIINPSLITGTPVGLTSPVSTTIGSKTIIVISRQLSYPNNGYFYTGFYVLGNDTGNRFSVLLNPSSNTYEGFNSNTGNELFFGTSTPIRYSNSYMSYDTTTGQYTYSVSQTGDLLDSVSATTIGSTGFNWVVSELRIGAYTITIGDDGLKTSANMSVVEVISVDGILSLTDFFNLKNYLNNKYYNIPLPTPTPTPTPSSTPVIPTPTPTQTLDPDASAYLSAVVSAGGTIDGTITNAVDTFYKGLKTNGLYSKLYAFYPMLGNNNDAFKIDGKLTNTLLSTGTPFSPSVSGASAGNGYFFTTPFHTGDYGTTNSASFGCYLTNVGTNNGNAMFMGDNDSNRGGWMYDWNTGSLSGLAFVGVNGNTYEGVKSRSKIGGFYMSTRTGSSFFKVFIDGNFEYNGNSGSNTPNNWRQVIGGVGTDSMGTGVTYSSATNRFGFVFWGQGLDDTESTTLSTLVMNLQTTLGRNA